MSSRVETTAPAESATGPRRRLPAPSTGRDAGLLPPPVLWGLRAAVLVALVAVPYVLGTFSVVLLTKVLALGLLAASLDLLVGYTGLPSLGHAAYFAVGAYAAALVAQDVTANGPLQLVIALVAGAVAAAATGWVAVRTRGVYFLMLTLAIAEIVYSLATSWNSVTGGSNGLAGLPRVQVLPGGDGLELDGYVYWYELAVVVLAYLLLRRVVGSPFGRTLAGIRENEARMRAIGYSTAVYKLAVFCLAGAVAGIAGALYVQQQRFISPGDVAFSASALALITVVLGGVGTLWGSFLGAGVVVLVRDQLAPEYANSRGTLLLGIVFVAVVYLLPSGLAGGLRALGARVFRRPSAAPPVTAGVGADL